jgi:hypothetical protein
MLRFKEAREHTELLFGINTAVTINTSFSPPKEAKSPFDFMPSKMGEASPDKHAPAPPKRFNRQKFADGIRKFLTAMPPHLVKVIPPAEKKE